MPKGIVGKDITFQLIGASGPVRIGTYEEFEVTANPEVNDRALADGSTESEATGMSPWSIRIKRPKRDSTLDTLLDAAMDPSTAPALQGVQTIAYKDGSVKQHLYTGITVRGGGYTQGRSVDENIELAADKRKLIA